MTTIDYAKHYWKCGFAVIPLHLDGRKASKIRWGEHTTSNKGVYEWWRLAPYFYGSSGIGLLCGSRSGNLEVLDFDNPDIYPKWEEQIDPTLLATLAIIATPDGGRHIYWRCDTIGRSIPDLAKSSNGKDAWIELKGEGCYVVACGSPPQTHKTGRPYKLISGNPFRPPTITPEQRATMLEVGKTFNEYHKPQPPKTPPMTTYKASKENRAGDIFNATAEWEDILEPAGWTLAYTRGDVGYWTKPDGLRGKTHATTDYGNRHFVCFSTNAPPFQAHKRYSKFAVYTLLYHDDDFRKSAQHLTQCKGDYYYGTRQDTTKPIKRN